jgi:hypothetical protein
MGAAPRRSCIAAGGFPGRYCQAVSLSRSKRFHRQLLAGWRFILSWRKKDWAFEDYPVSIVRQKSKAEETPEFAAVPRYRAEVVNWLGLCGTGNTTEAAVEDLRRNFSNACAHRNSMPRPGAKVPIQFASTSRIDAKQDLADQFIWKVLELEWAFISDKSSLWDFTSDGTLDAYFAKIKDVFGVDASGVKSGNIAEILELIAAARLEGQTKAEEGSPDL